MGKAHAIDGIQGVVRQQHKDTNRPGLRERSRNFFERYERRLSSLGLIFGFLGDSLVFHRVGLLPAIFILFMNLSVAALGILSINFYEAKLLRGRVFDIIYYWAPLVVQAAFGGLFRGFVIFYSSSASLGTSWPFLLLLLGILVGNEFFKKRYLHLVFPVTILFVALFSFFIFYVPIILGQMGPLEFIISGVVSLLVLGLFLYVLSFAMSEHVKQNKKVLLGSIGGIYIAITVLYFLNIIPPIPLSLKEVDVYHAISHSADGYHVFAEDRPWYAMFQSYEPVHVVAGEPIYVFSAVFAPTRISTEIFHVWQHYNDRTKTWETTSRAHFPIVGGRDGGYRGYTESASPAPGLWRVSIETSRGQHIGSINFNVERVDQKPSLTAKVL